MSARRINCGGHARALLEHGDRRHGERFLGGHARALLEHGDRRHDERFLKATDGLFWSTVTDDMLNSFLESKNVSYFDAVTGLGAVKVVLSVRFYLQRVARFGKGYSSDVTGDGLKRIKHRKAPLEPTRIVGQQVQRSLTKTRERVTPTLVAGSVPPQRAPKRQCGGLVLSGGLDEQKGERLVLAVPRRPRSQDRGV